MSIYTLGTNTATDYLRDMGEEHSPNTTTGHQPMSDLQSYESSHGHLRALWNLYTHLLICNNQTEAATVRAAIAIAEKEELDAVGKF